MESAEMLKEVLVTATFIRKQFDCPSRNVNRLHWAFCFSCVGSRRNHRETLCPSTSPPKDDQCTSLVSIWTGLDISVQMFCIRTERAQYFSRVHPSTRCPRIGVSTIGITQSDPVVPPPRYPGPCVYPPCGIGSTFV